MPGGGGQGRGYLGICFGKLPIIAVVIVLLDEFGSKSITPLHSTLINTSLIASV